jgi:alkanesulfonate monooxygenase SsuD/methylene tetrahydromethanopterin reductase-like flavin-dependent oxidoreductase (luciferase family)
MSILGAGSNLDFGLVLQSVTRDHMQPADLHAYVDATVQALTPPFTTLWMEDHFQWDDRPTLEAFTTMAYLAATYPRFTIGSLVFGQSYRNPALLAKMGATLQYLSGGRLVMGLGAGWKDDEYRAYGYDFPRAGVRIAQLAEAITLMRALWSSAPASYVGNSYRAEQAYSEPRPQPMIPILVGGAGEHGTLRVVAQLADAWNHDSCDYNEYAHKYAVLTRHCDAVGRDVRDITLTYYGHVDLPDDPRTFPPRSHIYMLGPTPADVVAQLRPFITLGVTHIMIQPTSIATLERFCRDVVPGLASTSATQGQPRES